MIETLSLSAAFTAGLLSFFSPCVLPLIPAYFTFITGFSLEELTTEAAPNIRKNVILSTIAFVLGFSVVFILIFGASASLLGSLVSSHAAWLQITGGIIVIILGIHLTGLIPIRFLQFEKRMHLKEKPVHVFSTFLVGMAFGAGWSPCIGPMLASILYMAGNQETVARGIFLLAIYSAGMALPFLVISVFTERMLMGIRKLSRYLRIMNTAAGILLILIGVVLLTDKMNWFVIW